jgi:energy-coupling factor transporter ATP-binding protein EcfA2
MTAGDMLLSVEDLVVRFRTHEGTIHAVNGVSFQLEEGERLGLVGESGCGKSVTMLSILSLNSKPGRLDLQPGAEPGPQMESFLRDTKKYSALSTGQALFRGEDILRASNRHSEFRPRMADQYRQLRLIASSSVVPAHQHCVRLSWVNVEQIHPASLRLWRF